MLGGLIESWLLSGASEEISWEVNAIVQVTITQIQSSDLMTHEVFFLQ